MWSVCLSQENRNALIRGQIISLFIAGTGVFATLLSNTTPSSNFPSLMSLFNYALLSTFLFRNRCSTFYNQSSTSSLSTNDDNYSNRTNTKDITRESTALSINDTIIPPTSSTKYRLMSQPQYFWYVLAALLDLEANFLVISAYNYTTVTSIMLLDCFTIPCVMFLSYMLLNYHYSWRHIFGITVCLAGLGLIIYTDFVTNDEPASATNPALGDGLCLLGSALYACSNVLQETLVKTSNRTVYLGYLGLFGSVFALIQCMILDLSKLETAVIGPSVALYMVGFVMCLFFMYTNTSLFLQDNDSTLFNLSLLTSDVYAVIFSYFLYQQLVHWFYFVAFGFVVCGLFLYHSALPPSHTSSLLRYEEINSVDNNIGNDNDDNDNDNIGERRTTTSMTSRFEQVNEESSLFAHSGSSNSSSLGASVLLK